MLSTTAQYALRALSQLAAMPPDQRVLGRELATRSGVPANYLSKLLLTLGNAGLIEASRGTGGGYRLARKPERVFLAEIVELIDGGVARPQCLLGLREDCSDADPCCAHQSWRGAKQYFLKFLKNTTLADISGSVERPSRTRTRRARTA
jgi:Rrf2 family iron-sulfur cluster assembly transcriptional regulator